MELCIIAGGRGSRMQSTIPKSLLCVDERPLIIHQIKLAKAHGIRKITVLTGYRSELIQALLDDGMALDVNISYSVELEPLGTAGAIRELAGTIQDRFLVFYGDVLINMNLEDLIRFDQMDPDSIGTLVIHPNNHPNDSDLLAVDENRYITNFYPKPRQLGYYQNMVSAGAYILSPKIFDYLPEHGDFGKTVFPQLLKRGEKLRGYTTAEYLKDIGTPERLQEVEQDYQLGRIYPKTKAIFLDRDGVINPGGKHINYVEEFKLSKTVGESIRRINRSGYLAIVITNQGGIEEGFITHQRLREIHNKMDTLLGEHGAYLDGLYYCPHFKTACECRKPKPGLFYQAKKDFKVSLPESFFIGDMQSDVEAGRAAGIQTKLIRDRSLLDIVKDII